MPIDSVPRRVPKLLEVAHVAHRIGFCEEHVRRLIRRKELTAIRMGRVWRVDPADLLAFIDAQRQASHPPANGAA